MHTSMVKIKKGKKVDSVKIRTVFVNGNENKREQ